MHNCLIFELVKFRSMTNEKDKDGNLLPDEMRLNDYGKFLRATSLDELSELYIILKGGYEHHRTAAVACEVSAPL